MLIMHVRQFHLLSATNIVTNVTFNPFRPRNFFWWWRIAILFMICFLFCSFEHEATSTTLEFGWRVFFTLFLVRCKIFLPFIFPQAVFTSEIMSMAQCKIAVSYTLGRENRVMRNWYSRLLFTSEDRRCANLRVQEQSTNMTSQCVTSQINCGDVTMPSQKRPSLATVAKWAIDDRF